MELALIGSGIAASPSPAMHLAALTSHGIAGGYRRLDVTSAGLVEALEWVREHGRGANVTMPHKQAVAERCDRLEGDAEALRVVNTITVEEGLLVGGNTDAAGLETALRERGVGLSPPRSAVVLGAGGAAAAALLALHRLGVASIAVTSRRPGAAAAAAAAAAPRTVEVIDWRSPMVSARLGEQSLLLNATPSPVAGLPLELTALPPSCVVADLRYRPRPVDLVAAAQSLGLIAFDGVAMLLHQAALSFERWTGLPAPIGVMEAALLAELAA